MAITDAFVLPLGVLLQPLEELTPDLRKRIRAERGDYVLSRVNARTQTKVLGREAAELVELFRKPTTIARAIARFSRGKDGDPAKVLEDALPLLQTLIAEGLLAKAGSPQSQRIEPSLRTGSDVFGWTAVRCVQTSEDVELYQMRDVTNTFAAFKIGRTYAAGIDTALQREAKILTMAGDVGARMIRSGAWEGRPYVLLEWVRGASAQRAFSELRDRSHRESRTRLRDLGGLVIEAYARLHERGILHGDVHPRNVLIDARTRVRLVDFGLACIESQPDNVSSRGGIGFFFEPELALRMESGGHPLTAAGEQYSVAAMLYLLVVGSHYLDFSLERDAMLRQIAEERVIPFAHWGVAPWPAAERVLARALNKHPQERFSSMREFADAWATCEVSRSDRGAMRFETTRFTAFVARVLEEAATGGDYHRRETAPTCSVNHGAAGVALGACRIACAADLGETLALADVWARRAILHSGEADAFVSEELEMGPDATDAASPYHGPGGTHIAQATVAIARDDLATACASTRRYIEQCSKTFLHFDLTFGQTGALLGSTLLLEVLLDAGASAAPECNALRLVGGVLLDDLWRTVGSYERAGGSPELTHLGIAHGWAGLLYATCCWCSLTRTPLPNAFAMRASELADCAEPIDRGLRWIWGTNADGNTYMPGWCNGSAGYVFLWDEAYRATANTSYLDLAEGAAWNVWESGIAGPSLCCGAAGQAYALLRWYRRSRDAVWLTRARELANLGVIAAGEMHGRAPAEGNYWHPESLYKGDVGVAALAADLDRPEYARMPMFECEGFGAGENG